MTYDHTQRAPLHLLLDAIAIAIVCGAWAAHLDSIGMLVVGAVALLIASCGLMFQHLTVRDEGSHLAIRYGPLPVFHRRIAYDEITSVEPSRSSLIDGWGIHYVPFRGWTYNLWGFDCAKVVVHGKVIRIGSDDVVGLVSFLRDRLSQAS